MNHLKQIKFKRRKRSQIKVILLIMLLIIPALLTVIIGWIFDLEAEYVDEYFLSTPIIMLPVLVSIGRKQTEKWIVYLLVVSGFTFGLLLSTCLIDESNLWPFSIIFGPIMSIPAIGLYLVLIDFIERCKSDRNLKW